MKFEAQRVRTRERGALLTLAFFRWFYRRIFDSDLGGPV